MLIISIISETICAIPPEVPKSTMVVSMKEEQMIINQTVKLILSRSKFCCKPSDI